MQKILDISRWLMEIVFYPLRVPWSVILYPAHFLKNKRNPINGVITPQPKTAGNVKNTVLYLHGYGQWDFTELTIGQEDTELEVIVPKTYSNAFIPYSFTSHAEVLAKRVDHLLHNTENSITIFGYSTGCGAALSYYFQSMSTNHQERIKFIAMNSFSSFYHAVNQRYPGIVFILFCIHIAIIGAVSLSIQQPTVTTLNPLSYFAIALLALSAGGLICAALIYATRKILSAAEINALVNISLMQPIENLFKRALYLLNPTNSCSSKPILHYACTLPLRIICALFLAILTIPFIIGLICEKIIFNIPKPFFYFLLFIMDSHHNFANKFNQTKSRLLAPPIHIIQATENDNTIPKEARLLNNLTTNTLEQPNIRVTRNAEDNHEIKYRLDQYLH